MSGNIVKTVSTTVPRGNEFGEDISRKIKKSDETGRPFSILILQIGNMDVYRKRRPPQIVANLMHEIYRSLRIAVHQSQFVGAFQNGFGLVFDAMDVGMIDGVARKLVALTQHCIRSGKYNDLSSRWTDIIQQFLWPNKPAIIYPVVGWAIYPRDGGTPEALVKRALLHATELNR